MSTNSEDSILDALPEEDDPGRAKVSPPTKQAWRCGNYDNVGHTQRTGQSEQLMANYTQNTET